jgi:DNA-binding beta-propeller fold protein YncE
MVGAVVRLLALMLGAACAASAPPDRIFVSHAGSATISALDSSSNAAPARIEVGLLPHQLVVSPDHRTLYAVLVGSQAVAEIDMQSARLRRTFLTAPVPAFRADGSAIQAHQTQNAFAHTTCYDCHRDGGAAPKYAGDRPFGMVLSADGRSMLVSHLRSSDLAVIDVRSTAIERTVHLEPAGAATEPVALARLGNEIWVALRPPQPSTLPGALRRLDASTLAPIGDVPTGSDPGSLLALPERERVLVSNFESNTVTEHAASGAAIPHEAAPGPLGLLALPQQRVLVLDYYSNAVTFLDFRAAKSSTIPLAHAGSPFANPTHAALSSDGRSAWVVTSGTEGHLLQVDLASAAILRDVPIDGLSFDVALIAGDLR